jgi:hypothetical protein
LTLSLHGDSEAILISAKSPRRLRHSVDALNAPIGRDVSDIDRRGDAGSVHLPQRDIAGAVASQDVAVAVPVRNGPARRLRVLQCARYFKRMQINDC